MLEYIGPLPVVPIKGDVASMLPLGSTSESYTNNPDIIHLSRLSVLTDSSPSEILSASNAFSIIKQYTRENPLVTGDYKWYHIEGSENPSAVGEYNNEVVISIKDDVYDRYGYIPYSLFVDSNNHLSVANVDIYSDEGFMMITSGVQNNDGVCSELLQAGSVTPEQPEPEGGRFGLQNRFSPRLRTNGIGVYPLSREQVQTLLKNLWNKTVTEKLQESLGFYKNIEDMIMSLKWFYGFKAEIKQTTEDCYLCIGSKIFDNSAGEEAIITRPLISEYVEFQCGLRNVEPHFNNYLDYTETKYQIYIPFVGFVDLNPSDILGGYVGLQYNVNMVTGDALAIVVANNPRTNGKDVQILSIPCNISIDCPLTYQSMDSLFLRGATMAGKAVVAGATAGVAGGSAVNAGLAAMSAAKYNDDASGWRSALSDTAGSLRKIESAGIAGGIASSFHGNTPSVSRGAGFTNETGNLGTFKPFILITRPVKATPSSLTQIYGQRSLAVKKLSDCHGYTKVVAVKPDSLPKNNKHLDEIISLLQSGIYL